MFTQIHSGDWVAYHSSSHSKEFVGLVVQSYRTAEVALRIWIPSSSADDGGRDPKRQIANALIKTEDAAMSKVTIVYLTPFILL